VEHDVQLRLHQEGDELTGLRRAISVIEQTLRKNPGRMIFPLTGLLADTVACAFHVAEARLPVSIACAALPGSDCSP